MNTQVLHLTYGSRASESMTLTTGTPPLSWLGRLAVVFTLLGTCALTFGQSQTPLTNPPVEGMYARAIRLAHQADTSKNGLIVAGYVTWASGSQESIYTSSDGGNSFTYTGAAQDSLMATSGLSGGGLYELPAQLGSLPAGTLLWVGAVGQNGTAPMQLQIFQSANQGSTWSYLSNCATAGEPKGDGYGRGVWEGTFATAKDGALVCYYSDETDMTAPSGCNGPCWVGNQVIQEVRSYDGVTWSKPTPAILSRNWGDRPGMPTVTELPNGTYFMAYELCGETWEGADDHGCEIYSTNSPDGWTWNAADTIGTPVLSTSGQYLVSSPTSAFDPPTLAAPNGTLLLIAGDLLNSDGSLASGTGHTIFTAKSTDGSGPWTPMVSPVNAPNTNDDWCTNVSPTMLPSEDGLSVLELSSIDEGGTCTMYYGTSAITVTLPYTIAAPSLHITSGSAFGNSLTVTVTSQNGFSGSVVLTAALTGVPDDLRVPPTVSFGSSNSATVSVNDTTPGTATLTITSAAPTTGSLAYPGRKSMHWNAMGGTALAFVLLFGLPARVRRWRSTLGMLTLLVATLGSVVACGSGTVSSPGTTAGNYTVTVTGTSGSTVVKQALTFTIQ